MKKLSKFEIATIKRTAQSVAPLITKRNKVTEKINKLNEEYASIATMIASFEEAIKSITGGYTTEDLIDKIVEPTDNVDKNGNQIKVTKFIFKYPDTIIPVSSEENTEDSAEISTEETEKVEDSTNTSDDNTPDTFNF